MESKESKEPQEPVELNEPWEEPRESKEPVEPRNDRIEVQHHSLWRSLVPLNPRNQQNPESWNLNPRNHPVEL